MGQVGKKVCEGVGDELYTVKGVRYPVPEEMRSLHE